MTTSTDVGSLPPRVAPSNLREGARKTQTVERFLPRKPGEDPLGVFEREVVSAFIDKLRAGIEVPNYPQFRDMNEMILEMLLGITRTGSGYIATQKVYARSGSTIPEVSILKQSISKIRETVNLDKVPMRICITGPYTLSSSFSKANPELLRGLGEALADIASRSIFSVREGEVTLLSIDEPVLGFLNDPLLDRGSEGREVLIHTLEQICATASSRKVETMLHLHNTSENLFWEVEHLNIIEPHVDDPLYRQENTKKLLDEADKRLKASISVTRFDDLIRAKTAHEEDLGNIWTDIRRGKIKPENYLEDIRTMVKRLRAMEKTFGAERISYAGPECGLQGFPSYDCAMECLRRTAGAVKKT
ncbi:hypothetical protein MUO93_08080 [Candidatus Bathyarchaeota archaeon]|nr:hypothetical protein [Candidatus Bathyarchaeota archaeon]